MGAATVATQMVADGLGVPLERVAVRYGDSDLPIGPGAGGSAQTATLAGSIEKACAAMRSRLDAAAAKAGMPDGSPAEDVLGRVGESALTVSVGADGGLRATWGQVQFLTRTVLDSRRWMKAATAPTSARYGSTPTPASCGSVAG